MRKWIIPVLSLALLSACSDKDLEAPLPAPPAMQYTNLNDFAVKTGRSKSIDLDKDGANDVSFHTLLVGDPVYREDKTQFYVANAFHVSMQINDNGTPALSAGQTIASIALDGHQWYNANAILLVEKVLPESGGSFWRGTWQNVSHKYVGFQVQKNGKKYYGWVEISVDIAAEQILLHRAAISTRAGQSVKAGE